MRPIRPSGGLDAVTVLLPDPTQFLYSYIRKEAVLSSQIEGTQSSLSDLLLFENEGAPGAPLDDVEETSNYVAAMNHGLARIESGELPLSNRLLREVHARLMRGVRGGDKAPGEFRRTQNWLGGTRPGNARFVPPPPPEVVPAMSDLEKFLHDRHADPHQGRPRARAVRDHPSLPRWQRTCRATPDHPLADLRARCSSSRCCTSASISRSTATPTTTASRPFAPKAPGRSGWSSSSKESSPSRVQRPRPLAGSGRSSSATERRSTASVAARRPRCASTSWPADASRFPPRRVGALWAQRADDQRCDRPAGDGELLREVSGRKRGRLYVYDAYLALLLEQ